jgi:hypothetical protein
VSAPDLETLLSRLAVSGRFDPARLLSSVPDEHLDALSAQLAELCEEDQSGGKYRWVLRASARRAALERFGTKDALRRAIAAAPAKARGDSFARMLRESLKGKLRPRRGRIDPVLEEARQAALQFVRHVPALPSRAISDALDDARMRIALREREDALSIVLGRDNKLFGRREEMRRIRHFVERRTRDVRPLLVTGIGGVGKSTLLAAVIRTWGRRHEAPTVVLLDFDRPALSSGEPIEIAREFTRQLSFEWITSKTLPKPLRHDGHRVLREKRANLTATYEVDGEVRRLDGESQFSRLQSLLFQPLITELPAALREVPVALVMDTFEIVGRQGPEVTRRVLDLEAALRQQVGFTRLRTIVSGRGIPLGEDLAVQHFGPRKRWSELEGLEEDAAAAFLAACDRRRKFRNKAMRLHAARVLKGHPLALLVLERYARQHPAAEIERLLRDVEHYPGFSAEFAQTFLYARILERIADPEVRALAHPGLVLRYVTPDLIRLVLAGPCGIGPIPEPESLKLFSKLKDEYWLVEVSGAGVRHRPDLRRLMLPGLFARPRPSDPDEVAERKRKLRDAAIDVCRAARDFYRDGPPLSDSAHAEWAALVPRTRLAEQFYYDGLSRAAPPSSLSRQDAADIQSELREDLDTMPTAWRALIKAVLGGAPALSEEEVATLGGDLRERVERERIDADLLHGETARARARSRKARARQRAVEREATMGEQRTEVRRTASQLDLIEKEVLASFADADVDAARKIGGPLIEAFGKGTLTEDTSKSAKAGRLWETALWKTILASPWDDPWIESALNRLAARDLGVSTSMALLVAAGTRKPHPALRGHLDPRAQSLDHTRLLAAYLARGIAEVRPSHRFQIGADTLAVGTLVQQSARSRERREPFIEHMRPLGSMILRFIEAPPPVHGLRLEELELLYRAHETIELDFAPQRDAAHRPRLLENLRGLTPELHQSTRRVLLDQGDDMARVCRASSRPSADYGPLK